MFKGAAGQLQFNVLVLQVGFFSIIVPSSNIHCTHSPLFTKKWITYFSAFGCFGRFGGWCGDGSRGIAGSVALKAGRQKQKVGTK